MTQRTAPLENWHLERGFELLRTFGLVRWGLGGGGHVEGGEPKSVKRLRSGDLLLETNSALQTKSFLLAKTFLDSPVNIIPHKSLNTSRGVISEPDLLTTPEAEILDGFSDQGVIQLHQSDSKLCSKWKLEKKFKKSKQAKNISYPEARKLILPQISQTYSQATKSSTTTTTTQTDDSITKIVCPPLKLLQPLTAVLKPTMPLKFLQLPNYLHQLRATLTNHIFCGS
ncbi:uncharacterized protein TNCV_4051191 [Trichonephila clavipes]|nr:uncharacterized protein TNCV_4051191 [Trichonephila clavipes]